MPSFLIWVEVFKIFSQSRVPQRLLRFLLDKLVKGFYALFPTGRKCEDPAHPGVGTGCGVELMDAVSLAGVWFRGATRVRRLLLVAERQEWSWLARSLLVFPLTQWLEQPLVQTVPGLPVSHGGYWKNFPFYVACVVALFALGYLDFAFALVSFSLSVFGCCLWSTSYFRDTCFAWFNSGYMFYERLLANFTFFLRAVHSDSWRSSPLSRMEKCAQLMLRVVVSLRAVRALKLDIISTSSSCDGVGLTHFASFFALLRLSRS